ncbi:PhzF family phenazine biosynthesis protein [uncultured Intestinimonas sp.]|uniref:PhzF family phenazine biosynthesis protein n=1 Tax=uncultured Intestinimonas sp. TaxID=1689265 RepID=UPI0026390D9C|nr:PhzF family phenazine biosynthesis protein [uncultured Intestinimonas sp.]
MKLYIVDAFTTRRFSGNQAGVALLEGEDFPEEALMQALAAELKHSETVFVKDLGEGAYQLRYFTPEGEVDLCGHATISAFTVLREEMGLAPSAYLARTLAGELAIQVSGDAVWMDMAPPVEVRSFEGEEAAALYAAYGLSPEDGVPGLLPRAVSTGLKDILLPVRDQEVLDRAVQDEGEVTRLSRKYEVVGVHMFCPGGADGATAHCRNFAPLYAIPEEAATGTSNGALTYYLYRYGGVAAGEANRFVQGEKMGKPSEVLSRLEERDGRIQVQVGGRAVLALRAELL